MAAFDLGKKIDRERLHKAIKTSRDALRPFRRSRVEMIREYVGSWYSTNGARFPTYVHKLASTASIYTAALAFNNPKVRIQTFEQPLWAFARKFSVNVNRVVANIDLKTTIQACVLDAFFMMGIAKIRMADSGDVQLEDNLWIDPGMVWVDRVSHDDAILDLAVKDIRAMRFYGDRYRVAYRKVRDREDFDRKVTAKMSPTSKLADDGGSRASDIASGGVVDDDELEPMVWLEDVYLPEFKQLVTFAADNPDLAPLRVLDWDGRSPYKFLGLGLVPDNVIPLSPAVLLKALHDLTNRLYRKLSAQATRQKNLVAYEAGAEDDALNVKNGVDGAYVKLRNPKSITPINFPGVDGGTNAFWLASQEVYNVQSGNERAIGGLGADEATLGQQRIVMSQANGRVAAMKSSVDEFTADICREIGMAMWDDEFLTVQSSMDAEGTGFYVDTSWQPGEREGLKDQYDFSVEPNSMAYRPPEAKLEQILGFVQQVASAWPMVQAGILDVQELTRNAAELQNLPELLQVFKFMTPQQLAETGGDPHQRHRPPVTTRETVRTNRSTGPRGDGMSAVLGQLMQQMGSETGATVG